MLRRQKNISTLIKWILGFFGLSLLIFAGSRITFSQNGTITYPTPIPQESPAVPTPAPDGGGSNIVQPSPQIIHPQNNSRLSGNVVIEIFIEATVISEMNVFCITSSSKNFYLGRATQTQGTYWQLWWNTNNLSNGEYLIYAQATLANGIKTFSGKIHLYVENTAQVQAETPDETGQAETEQGVLTQTHDGNQTNLVAQAPETNVPQATPPPATDTTLSENLLENSRLITTVDFKLDQDKPLHLGKIEARLSFIGSKFLVFSGQSYPDSYPLMTINSQPLVLSAKADRDGNWTYILENPLEGGKHEVYVEVDTNGVTEKSGPYPFTIARAQASADNPTGASLDLVDPQKQALKTYLFIAGGLVGLALLIMAIYFYIKHTHKKALNYP